MEARPEKFRVADLRPQGNKQGNAQLINNQKQGIFRCRLFLAAQKGPRQRNKTGDLCPLGSEHILAGTNYDSNASAAKNTGISTTKPLHTLEPQWNA